MIASLRSRNASRSSTRTGTCVPPSPTFDADLQRSLATSRDALFRKLERAAKETERAKLPHLLLASSRQSLGRGDEAERVRGRRRSIPGTNRAPRREVSGRMSASVRYRSTGLSD
jgi:hypothetical protein